MEMVIRGKIERETAQAVLVEVTVEEVTSGGEFFKKELIWLPKSQIEIREEEIYLPPWLWQAKNREIESRTRAGCWEICAREIR